MSHRLDMKMIRESFPSLILALIADSIAGYLLNSYLYVFVAIPGLLMVIPALIDMRGNVYGAFISRLSSKLHLGEIKSLDDEKVKIGTATAKLLAYSAALIIASVVSIISFYTTGNPLYLILIPTVILVTHLFTASILTPITAYIGVKAYQGGWNPDNVGVPLISSVGDFVSVFFIIFSALALLYITNPLILFFIFFAIFLYVIYIGRMVFHDREGKKVYAQSMPILIGVALLELITGGLWELNKIAVILLILPPTLETLGNIGSIFSSRLSSFIYLGFVEPTVIPRGRHFRKEILSIIFLSAIIYSLISVIVFFLTFEIRAVVVVWLSAFISIVVLLLLGYYFTIGSLKLKLDPDNIVVPLITTLADIIGTSAILFSYFLIF